MSAVPWRLRRARYLHESGAPLPRGDAAAALLAESGTGQASSELLHWRYEALNAHWASRRCFICDRFGPCEHREEAVAVAEVSRRPPRKPPGRAHQ